MRLFEGADLSPEESFCGAFDGHQVREVQLQEQCVLARSALKFSERYIGLRLAASRNVDLGIVCEQLLLGWIRPGNEKAV